MQTLLTLPPSPIGLQAFVPNFESKAKNLTTALADGPAARRPGRRTSGLRRAAIRLAGTRTMSSKIVIIGDAALRGEAGKARHAPLGVPVIRESDSAPQAPPSAQQPQRPRKWRRPATVIATPGPRGHPPPGGIADRNQGHGDSQRITRPGSIVTIRRAKRCHRADREWRPYRRLLARWRRLALVTECD